MVSCPLLPSLASLSHLATRSLNPLIINDIEIHWDSIHDAYWDGKYSNGWADNSFRQRSMCCQWRNSVSCRHRIPCLLGKPEEVKNLDGAAGGIRAVEGGGGDDFGFGFL